MLALKSFCLSPIPKHAHTHTEQVQTRTHTFREIPLRTRPAQRCLRPQTPSRPLQHARMCAREHPASPSKVSSLTLNIDGEGKEGEGKRGRAIDPAAVASVTVQRNGNSSTTSSGASGPPAEAGS